MSRVGERKQRSDKKKEIKPTVRIELKDAIYRLSYITYTPVKDVCEKLCIDVLEDIEVIGFLSQYFKRDIRLRNTLYVGHLSNQHIGRREEGITERVTIRFKSHAYELISLLGYALDCSQSRVVAILLEISMNNIRFINGYVKTYLGNELNEKQMRELRNVIRDVNKINGGHHSWASLLAHITDEVSTPIIRVRDAVNEFIKKSM